MRTCKHCSTPEGSTNWPKGKGLVCLKCKALNSAEYRTNNLQACREAVRVWHATHKDSQRIKHREWKRKNRAKCTAATNAWKAKNFEKWQQINKNWKLSNYAKVLADGAAYRAAKLQRTVAWADAKKIKAIYAKAIAKTKKTGIPHHVDHIVPIKGKLVSGLHVENNLQILKAYDNLSKGVTYEIA